MRPFPERLLEDATLVREGAGDRTSNGVFTPGVQTREAVRVASAPRRAGGEQYEPTAGGARHQERRTFWLQVDARALRRGEDRADSDYIEHDGRMYRVERVSDWAPDGFVEVVGVVPDAGDETIPTSPGGINDAPVIYPLGVVHGVPGLPLYLEIPAGETTTLDTGLTRADVLQYHTLGLTAIFPVFIQLVSVQYLLHHDGLDTAIGYHAIGHSVLMHLELGATLTIRVDLTLADFDVANFQIRGIG